MDLLPEKQQAIVWQRNMIIWRNIQRIADQRGWKDNELEKQTGIDTGEISKYRAGNNMGPKIFSVFVKGLGVSVATLLTPQQDPENTPDRTFPQEALEAYPHVLEGIIREVREAIDLGLSEEGLAKAIGTEMQKKVDIFTDLKKVNAS